MSRNADRTDAEPQVGLLALLARRPRRTLPIAAGLLGLVAIFAALAGGPYVFKGATLEGEVAAQLRETIGLKFKTAIPGRFDLLPRPHVVLGPIHIEDASKAFVLDAEAFEGDVRILPLVLGRMEITSATMTKPRVTLDLDGKAIDPASTIGRAIRGEPLSPSGEIPRLGVVTLVDGTATIRSGLSRRDFGITNVNVTLDWRDLDTPATLTGSARIFDTPTEIAAWVAQPSNLIRGDHSTTTLRLHSAPFDFAANGDLANGRTTTFRGRISTKAASVAAVMQQIGANLSLFAPFSNFSLDSDADVAIDPQTTTSIDLPNLKMRADGNSFEGALAFQSGTRPTLAGTLATEQLLLAPFVGRLPGFLDTHRRWADSPLVVQPPEPLDLDLRVSATHLRLAPFTIDDTALAVITRNDRTEIALAEGKAYGGAVKARFSVGLVGDALNLRATGTLKDADASSLSWDLFGRQLATGTLSASANLEANGQSPAALASNLQGWIRSTMNEGEFSGVDLGRAFREAQRKNTGGLQAALHGGRTSFSSLAFTTQIADGAATLDGSMIKGNDVSISLEGTAEIAKRRLDVSAVVAPAKDKSTADVAAPTLRLGLEGSFDRPNIVPMIAASPSSGSSQPP